MKRVYEKPQIMFEDFSLSTNIAACAVPTNLLSSGVCGMEFGPGIVLFDNGISQCNRDIDNVDDNYNLPCYHNPDALHNLFGS